MSRIEGIFRGIVLHATVRLLEIIGEACGSLSDEFNEANPIVDWQAWKDMRNILTDQSFGAGNRMKFP